jgi:hypothetical protein
MLFKKYIAKSKFRTLLPLFAPSASLFFILGTATVSALRSCS